jgi:Mitochondrial resolvase Ydc2 / RNA splicing MRS1
MTKIVSIDVGIKNLAYCIFEKIAGSPLVVTDWNSINLIQPENNIIDPKCNASLDKSKKGKECICNKKAKYHFTKEGEPTLYYCEKHAKSSKKPIFTKECSPTYLKKQKVDTLTTIITNLKLSDNPQDKKPQIIEKISAYYDQNTLKPIITKKTSANDVSLIEIGKSIKRELNNIPEMETITHVLIENQISPIATRMKTIQGLLAQYFIMKNDNIIIEFISSSNKLRNVMIESTENPQTASQKYKQHKIDSVIYTEQLLEKNDEFKKWLPILNTSKKDDLADCFLQGMWYIHKH